MYLVSAILRLEADQKWIDQHFSRPQSNHHHSSIGHSYSMHHQNQGGWASIYASPPVYAGGYPNNPSM